MPRRRWWPAALVTVVLVSAACGSEPRSPLAPTTAPSADVRAYLERIVDIMQASSIHRLTIDWPSFRSRVLAEAATAQTIPATFGAIRLALELLADGHSMYRPVNGQTIFAPRQSCAGAQVALPTLPDAVGYVQVRMFEGSADAAVAFANAIQAVLRDRDRDGLAGWIVDLRGNGGGNMWPMLAGLGPVLGEGLAGYFIDPLGQRIPWEYWHPSSFSGGTAVVTVTSPYSLRQPMPRVAVLTDARVASSGEATAIAFRGRPNTRSFGEPTCGLSTANRSFALSDGATLILTVSTMADRHAVTYGDRVAPDEVIANPDEVVPRAVAWLLGGT